MTPLARNIRNELIHNSAWLRGLNWGHRADLGGADLRGADLRDADLRYAYLHEAVLRGADLGGADLRGAIVTADGQTLTKYMEWLPTLLTAGGKTVAEVAEHWDCHTWSNCPMHAAFGADDIQGVPEEWRGHARVFINLFDSGVLPRPEVTA